MATVVLPRSLIALFPGTPKRVEAVGLTVGDIVTDLDRRVPGVRDRLCTAGPSLRTHINVFVDGRPARLETPVGESSTVHVIPAISGGARAKVALGTERAPAPLEAGVPPA